MVIVVQCAAMDCCASRRPIEEHARIASRVPPPQSLRTAPIAPQSNVADIDAGSPDQRKPEQHGQVNLETILSEVGAEVRTGLVQIPQFLYFSPVPAHKYRGGTG